MRVSRLTGAAALTLLAAPALAHPGDHGEHGPAHFLAQHGFAAAAIAFAVIAGGALFLYAKRKG